MKNTLTLGIVTYNRHDILKDALAHITKQSIKPDEVIIVDSSPRIFNHPILKELKSFCNTRYLKQESKTPLPIGRNIILGHCKTDLISFIDDDSLMRGDFVKNVLESFDNDIIGGVTGPTINSDTNLCPKLKIIKDNLPRNFITPWGDVYSDTRRWVPTKSLYCGGMIGANMSFRTNLVKAGGGFEENLINPSFREDTDSQIPIKRMGFKFLYNPDVFVYHIIEQAGGIEDIEEKRNKYFFLAGQNHRYFCDKYYPKWLTRIAWVLFNRNPPNLILSIFLTIFRKENYINWHKGLWSKE